jgi:DNA-nicking Smr family endonuclease
MTGDDPSTPPASTGIGKKGRKKPAASFPPLLPEEEDLFSQAMRGVAPVARKGREIVPAAPREPGALPAADPGGALRDLLEGRLEFSLTYSDEYMEGAVVGVDPAVLGRLRAGRFSPEAHLDLHGQNSGQAFASLSWFIRNAYLHGLRTVVVVTGRGRNSPNGTGVLRPLLPEWLGKDPFKRVVLAFCTARATDGGPGAVYILLRKYKKKRGKIIWDRPE